jgi:hypothetical protein
MKPEANPSLLKVTKGQKTCQKCQSDFIIEDEDFEFYKKMKVPAPTWCPDCRHHERLKNRNPLKLYKRTCQKEGCSTEFETTYAPDRKEIVYCEKCYNNEVV